MTNATLLVELLTEELPPKALSKLGEVFSAQIHAGLAARKLLTAGDQYEWFATPRRLAILVPGVLAVAPDASVTEKIMPVSVALDAAGQPTQALLKKLEAKGVPVSEVAKFEKRMDGKAEALFYQATIKGAALDEALAGIVADALKKLPIPKVMRWGDTDHQFVRPVHGLILMHGERVVPGGLLGLTSRAITRGHRFLSSGDIVIKNAEAYADALKTQGKVIARFADRKASIAAQLDAKAAELKATINPSEGLLDEVTSLVEWPVVYVGEFESEYLEVPQECLILTMQQNQKYFPLLDSAGKLLNKFLIVSNMQVDDPKHIVGGNARVVRPRLSDARFFYTQDRKTPLASRLEKLGSVVYHNKLGSVLQRVERIEALAGKIAAKLGADVKQASRAARLAKADLVTDMVGEFPELQGIMGRYYALHDGEDKIVADAVQSHYQPRFAGDALPDTNIGRAAALADKLDALVGFFGIGQLPTGDKDPFGLRRAALGVLRILMESPLALDLSELIVDAQAGFGAGVLTQPVTEPLLAFMFDRLRGLLKDAGYAQDVVEAVLAQAPTRIDLVPAKLDAVRAFLTLPDALALAAANKRIGNILKKVEGDLPFPTTDRLIETAEIDLYARVQEIAPVVAEHVQRVEKYGLLLLVGGSARAVRESMALSYGEALRVLATVRTEVDLFFDKVMVNVDDSAVRANRLGLLKALFDQLNAVADISKLGV